MNSISSSAPRIRIPRADGWSGDLQSEPGKPITLLWGAPGEGAALQVSFAVPRAGSSPLIGDEELLKIATTTAAKSSAAPIETTGTSGCRFGRCAFARFSPQAGQECQLWVLSDKIRLVFVTLTAPQSVFAIVLERAAAIAFGTTLTAARPWYKFW
jgi:hypothetical protein